MPAPVIPGERLVNSSIIAANEGVSLLENAAHLGLPIPKKLKDVLAQIHDRASALSLTAHMTPVM